MRPHTHTQMYIYIYTHVNTIVNHSTLHSILCTSKIHASIWARHPNCFFSDRGSQPYTLYTPCATCSTSVACWRVAGDLNRIRALVDKDADVNAQDDFGPMSNQCHAISLKVYLVPLPCSFEIRKISVVPLDFRIRCTSPILGLQIES